MSPDAATGRWRLDHDRVESHRGSAGKRRPTPGIRWNRVGFPLCVSFNWAKVPARYARPVCASLAELILRFGSEETLDEEVPYESDPAILADAP